MHVSFYWLQGEIRVTVRPQLFFIIIDYFYYWYAGTVLTYFPYCTLEIMSSGMSEHPFQSLGSQTHKMSQKVTKLTTRDDVQSIH